MTEPTTPPPIPSSSETDIGSSRVSRLACIQCSYDLAGLPLDGRCPECGTPIHYSTQGFLLRFASPGYLSLVIRGTTLLIAGLAAAIALTILSIAFSCAGATGLAAAAEASLLIPPFVLLAGYWLLSTPDPGFALTEQPNSVRRLLRSAVIAQGLLQIATIAFRALGWLSAFSPMFTRGIGGGGVAYAYRAAPPPATFAQFLLWITLLIAGLTAWAIQFFFALDYTRWLAARIPDADLIKSARTYSWLMPLLMILGAPLFFIGPITALVLYSLFLARTRERFQAVAALRASIDSRGVNP